MKKNPLPDLVVVTVNYRLADDTLACIASLIEAGISEQQIIFVDNGSGDKSFEKVTSRYPALQAYSLPENLGFSGGYNFGIQQALKNPVGRIFLLNNDTIVESKAIRLLAESSWDIAIPKILFHDQPEIIWAAGCRWRRFPPSVLMNGYQKPDNPTYDRPGSLSYATGCALMIKRQVLVELGGFDPSFENYMEDYDFCFRAIETGFSMGYVSQSRILHKVSRTLGKTSPSRWQQQGKNTVLFYRKDNRFPSWQLWTFLAWFMVRETIKLQIAILPHFWRGVRVGLKTLKNN